MAVRGALAEIERTLTGWPEIAAGPHRYGGTEFRYGAREVGHVHGDRWVDILFPKKVREELVAAGEADPHHLLRDSGWISFYLRQPEDVPKAIALFRRSYELAVGQRARYKESVTQHV
ncbi:MAG: DUF5519 family protein [Bryobacteraceae bacterium]|nr:DUF5519 family protein [Bryobacteraceae bacterium]